MIYAEIYSIIALIVLLIGIIIQRRESYMSYEDLFITSLFAFLWPICIPIILGCEIQSNWNSKCLRSYKEIKEEKRKRLGFDT